MTRTDVAEIFQLIGGSLLFLFNHEILPDLPALCFETSVILFVEMTLIFLIHFIKQHATSLVFFLMHRISTHPCWLNEPTSETFYNSDATQSTDVLDWAVADKYTHLNRTVSLLSFLIYRPRPNTVTGLISFTADKERNRMQTGSDHACLVRKYGNLLKVRSQSFQSLAERLEISQVGFEPLQSGKDRVNSSASILMYASCSQTLITHPWKLALDSKNNTHHVKR